MNRIRRFFWFCSGADVSILRRDECSTQQGRHAGVGATILLTAVFASLSAGYALFTIFHSYLHSIGFGLLWGMVIFNLDRVIVQSMKKRKGLIISQLMMAVPRIVLAILISLVITTPLELKIFEKEILDDIASTDVIKETEEARNIENKFHEITDIADQNRILLAAITTKEGARDKALEEVVGEALGTRGTYIRGAGRVWRQKTNYLNKVDEELNNLRTINTKQVQRNNERIEALKELRDKETDERKKTIQQGTGLLARIEALHNLARHRPATAGAILLIAALFLVIETAPIVVKLLSPYGPYDAILERQEAEVVLSEEQKILDIPQKVTKASASNNQMNQVMREFEYEQFNEAVRTARLSQSLAAVHDEVASEVVKGVRNSMLTTVRDLFGHPVTHGQGTAEAARRVETEARNAMRKGSKETAAFKARVEQAKAGVIEDLRQYGNNGSKQNSKAS